MLARQRVQKMGKAGEVVEAEFLELMENEPNKFEDG